MIFLQKFLTNWRAQRGKFLTISLMFRDFSCETLCVDKIISPPRGILCVDKNRFQKPLTQNAFYLRKTAIFFKIAPIAKNIKAKRVFL